MIVNFFYAFPILCLGSLCIKANYSIDLSICVYVSFFVDLRMFDPMYIIDIMNELLT